MITIFDQLYIAIFVSASLVASVALGDVDREALKKVMRQNEVDVMYMNRLENDPSSLKADRVDAYGEELGLELFETDVYTGTKFWNGEKFTQEEIDQLISLGRNEKLHPFDRAVLLMSGYKAGGDERLATEAIRLEPSVLLFFRDVPDDSFPKIVAPFVTQSEQARLLKRFKADHLIDDEMTSARRLVKFYGEYIFAAAALNENTDLMKVMLESRDHYFNHLTPSHFEFVVNKGVLPFGRDKVQGVLDVCIDIGWHAGCRAAVGADEELAAYYRQQMHKLFARQQEAAEAIGTDQ